jgi:hypothetical protein
MSYALFSNSEKVSKAYPTKSEVWQHAAESGLILEVGSGEEDPPRRLLDMGYAIHECTPDTGDVSHTSGMSEHEISQMISACQVSPPSAAAAS